MVPELGHFSLILALCLAVALGVVPLIGAFRGDARLLSAARPLAHGQFVFVVFAFACLVYSFISSDFSVQNVAANSNTKLPVYYRITASWGSHEGSLLLWVLMLAGWTFAVSIFSRNLPQEVIARVLAVMGLIMVGFLLFMLLTSNPFDRLLPAAIEGRDLNPLLQDPGMIYHPPMLYMGYVGFSVAFAFAVAALIGGKLDATWARWSRPWTTAAWCFLTIGIALGSAWAYYELGWGGWWFWDPVENASFMPWLAGTALLHSALVVERRNALVSWTILLGILTFSLSLVGTFLVRSGVLTSVHAFATDPTRGVFILALLVAATGGSLLLYTIRMPGLKYGAPFAPVSREGALTLNNMLLLVATGTVFLGTFYPLIVDLLTHDKISVGPPYFEITFVPIMIALLLAMAVGPLLKWKRSDLKEALAKLKPAAIAAGLMGLAVLALGYNRGAISMIGPGIGMGLAVWLVGGSLTALAYRLRLGSAPYETTIALARSTPLAFYGLIIAHAGMGMTVAGITGMTAWASEMVLTMKPGETFQHAGYDVKLRAVEVLAGANFEAQQGMFDVSVRGRPLTTLVAQRRFYPIREQFTTSAGIRTNLISNIYITLNEQTEKGWQVRFYSHPFVPWIWLGTLTMALGGFVSLADRRLRVGSPQTARRVTPPRSPVVPAPAE